MALRHARAEQPWNRPPPTGPDPLGVARCCSSTACAGWALAQQPVSAGTMRVAAHLAAQAYDGRWVATTASLGKALGLSYNTVARAFDDLVRRGFLALAAPAAGMLAPVYHLTPSRVPVRAGSGSGSPGTGIWSGPGSPLHRSRVPKPGRMGSPVLGTNRRE